MPTQRSAEYLKEENSRLKRRIRDLEYERKRKRVKPIPPWAESIFSLPIWMQDTAKEIVTDPSMRDTVQHVLARQSEFSRRDAAMLVAIGMDRKARAHFDRRLDKHWATTSLNNAYREIIIGGGLHAAIYAATRARMGNPKVLVLEKNPRPGGVFSCSRAPGFYLNSRNRPGFAPSRPGDTKGSLNYLPGCLIQPADMGGEEYQTNDVISWVIRANLALFADVAVNQNVFTVRGARPVDIRGRYLCTAFERIIIATGFGAPKTITSFKSDRYLTFEQFMNRMEKPFPLRGVRRVAVIGNGDSGKCVIEALTGKGPSMLTSNTLDYPEIDWYGVRSSQRYRQDWETCNRTRYKGIGALLRDQNYSDEPRVTLRGEQEGNRVSTIERGLDCVYLNGRPYDLVVECVGYRRDNPLPGSTERWRSYLSDSGGSSIAQQAGYQYTIGPCANIAPSEGDIKKFRKIGENGTSIFYLARKTEALALSFN